MKILKLFFMLFLISSLGACAEDDYQDPYKKELVSTTVKNYTRTLPLMTGTGAPASLFFILNEEQIIKKYKNGRDQIFYATVSDIKLSIRHNYTGSHYWQYQLQIKNIGGGLLRVYSDISLSFPSGQTYLVGSVYTRDNSSSPSMYASTMNIMNMHFVADAYGDGSFHLSYAP